MGKKYDVCTAVVSDLPYDARVWKEARSLAAVGYRVALIGCRYDIAQTGTRRDGAIDVVEIPFGSRGGKISHVARAQVLLELWWRVLRTNARVYHAHNIHPGPAALLASFFRRARLVYDGHEVYGDVGQSGVPGGRLAARASEGLERLLVRRSDVAFTTNRSRAEVLAARHGRQDVEVLANVPTRVGVVEALDPGYDATRPTLLYQGGIYAGRAFHETIQAIRLVDDVQFAILGFGRAQDIAQIRAWAETYGVADRVRFFGPRPFDELVRTAAAATIGIVPIKMDSLNHYLGDTNKLHEYLMAGLPVVASDIPEVRRVVIQGDPPVGVLFDAASPDSIASAIRAVLDPALYEARRREARRLALERYNWEVEEPRLLRAYMTIASPSGGRHGGGSL